ncbi:MAG: outer membrane lipoprotein-sorting protein [Panacagrimonas sp.]
MKPLLRCLLIAVSLLCLGSMQVNTEISVVERLECMRDNTPDRLRIGQLHISPKDGAENLPPVQGRLYLRRDKKQLRVMMQLTAPQDLAGTRYLLNETDQGDRFYVYLPALGKTRAIQAGGEGAQIAGTGLSYADLRLITQSVGGAAINLQGRKVIDGRSTQLLRFSTPGGQYERMIVALDDESCASLRVELHDKKGLAKRYVAQSSSLRQVGNFRYFAVGQLENRRGAQTATLRLREVSAPKKLSSKLFDPKRFHQASE